MLLASPKNEKIDIRKGIDNVIEIFEKNYDKWKLKQSSLIDHNQF